MHISLILIAAIVWLLIWRLLKSKAPDGNVGDTADTGTVTPDDSSDSRAKVESSGEAGEPAPGSEPEPEKKDPAKVLPSRAFSIWTKPSPRSADSAAADKGTDKAKPKPKAKPKNKGGKSAPEADSVPALDTATAEEAAVQFQADLDSGSARQDEALGILYNSAPDDADDLKEIKGVAKVLEAKLHDFGIYKFKQIAFWTDTAVAEFGQRLTFKDRIYRDDWIAQAKKFHEKKYGEKL